MGCICYKRCIYFSSITLISPNWTAEMNKMTPAMIKSKCQQALAFILDVTIYCWLINWWGLTWPMRGAMGCPWNNLSPGFLKHAQKYISALSFFSHLNVASAAEIWLHEVMSSNRMTVTEPPLYCWLIYLVVWSESYNHAWRKIMTYRWVLG